MSRPAGVSAIASVFFLTAAYLAALAAIMLLRPGAVSLTLGAPLLGGLELAGPYMFLLVAAVGVVIATGLLWLQNWARWLAIAAAAAGIFLLMPEVSAAVIEFRGAALLWSGLGIVVRVMIVRYLFQEPTIEAFTRRADREAQ